MTNIKKISVILCIILLLNIFVSCLNDKSQGSNNGGINNEDIEQIQAEIEEQQVDVSAMDFDFTDRDNRDSYSKNGAVTVKFSNSSVDISGNGASADGTTVTLTSEMTYIVSGETADGMLIVDCGDNDKIQIVFDGIKLTNSDGPAVYIKNADKVVVTIAEGSENILTDGSAYEYTDGDTNVDGTVFSKADVTFNGSGKLMVNGNSKHGIVSKDDLVITGGTYDITSKGVALNGKDCVKISAGTFMLDAGSDGIRSDNEEDSDRGYVYISGGVYNITSGNDGIQAQTVLKIENGTFNIESGGGSANASTKSDGSVNDNWGFGGNDFGGNPGNMRPGFRAASYTQNSYTSTTTSTESAKGIKSGSDIIISGGTFNIDSADDSVHSNGTVDIQNGTFNISSGDDGIHGDTALTVSGGEITVTKSYEGLESSDIVVSGGNISLISADDGLNAAGGNDSSAMNNRPGMGGFTNSTGRIAIAGGYLVVDAAGDGIDANGSIIVSGGVTIVYGPTNSGNGSLDYDSSASITGGTFIALGSAGMAQGLSSAENQGVITTALNNQSAGTSIALCDSEGNVVVSVTAKKTFSHIVVSCSGLQSGNKYSIVSGAEVKNTDDNGYAENTAKTGGTSLGEINLTSNVYGSSGGMGMGGRR